MLFYLFNKKYNKTKILSYSAIKWLEHYRWPGNVRELRNVIERLFITSSTDILDFESGYNVLPSAGSEPLAGPAARCRPSAPAGAGSLRRECSDGSRDRCGTALGRTLAAQEVFLHRLREGKVTQAPLKHGFHFLIAAADVYKRQP